MRLLHYAAEPFSGPILSREQRDRISTHEKPRGLWVSVEGEDDWPAWCRGERFRLDGLTHVHEVALAPGARVLRLASAFEIDAFTAQYARPFRLGTYECQGIDWRAVASDHQGLIIAPYIWSRRLDGGANWYYGWDCASGCIWDAEAVASVALLEVVPVPEPENVH